MLHICAKTVLCFILVQKHRAYSMLHTCAMLRVSSIILFIHCLITDVFLILVHCRVCSVILFLLLKAHFEKSKTVNALKLHKLTLSKASEAQVQKGINYF